MKNEPILEYRKGSSERKQLDEAIKKYSNVTTKVPCVIGGKEVDSKDVQYQLSVCFSLFFVLIWFGVLVILIYFLLNKCIYLQPYNHKHKVAQFSHANKQMINDAIAAGLQARTKWDRTPLK
jgi:1-pyrroline-5-carboxylate dehydrogenase